MSFLPDLKKKENGQKITKVAQLRGPDEVLPQMDLYYCLHWALRDAELTNQSPKLSLQSRVIVERRLALEWYVSDFDWDKVSLDT